MRGNDIGTRIEIEQIAHPREERRQNRRQAMVELQHEGIPALVLRYPDPALMFPSPPFLASLEMNSPGIKAFRNPFDPFQFARL